MNTSTVKLFGEEITINKTVAPKERASKRKRIETEKTLFKNLHSDPEKVKNLDQGMLERVEHLKKQTNFSSQDVDDIYLYRNCFWTVECPRLEEDKIQQENILERLINHGHKEEIFQRFHRLPERLRCYLFSQRLWRSFSTEDYSKFDLEALRKEESATASKVKKGMKKYLKDLIFKWEWEIISKYWEDQFFRNQYRETLGREIQINEEKQWNIDHSFNQKFGNEKVPRREQMNLVGEKIDYLKVMKRREDETEKRKTW